MNVIGSRLDNDFYAFTMGQVIQRNWPDLQVEYALTNRTTSVKLAEVISAERVVEAIHDFQSLSFTPEEVIYLKDATGFLSPAYVDHMAQRQLPMPEVSEKDGQFVITVQGSWQDAIQWETPLLAILTELYGKAEIDRLGVSGEEAFELGRDLLMKKIDYLKAEAPTAKIMEFGSRRRFTGDWQEMVIYLLNEHVPDQILGTSNVYLAMQHGLRPMGTMAHQMFMVRGAMAIRDLKENPLTFATNEVLDAWEESYSDRMLVALTDTWGTDFFLEGITKERGERYWALRQDSGHPEDIAEKILAWYEANGIDATEHMIVFSDGLVVERIADIERAYKDTVGTSYGWGTNLTNDVGVPPLSLVFKPVAASTGDNMWFWTVKLSDNIAKATGNPMALDEYKFFAKYKTTFDKGVTY